MRFHFVTAPQRTTWEWMLEVWQRADRHDVFEGGWTFDHFYPLFGDSTEDCMEGWMTLAALLHETERLRGGVLVTGMVYRHPAVLANMATTLDITSGGRLELGIGAGWNEEECEAYGIELGTLRERFDRFDEGMAVLEGLLTNDRTTFTGDYFQVTDAMNNPKPVQSPLPICIGGRGKTRTLPTTARYAHHWNFGGNEVDEWQECRDVLHAACADIGRDPAAITCSVISRWAEDADAFLADVQRWDDAGADLVIVGMSPTLPASAIDDVAAALATR